MQRTLTTYAIIKLYMNYQIEKSCTNTRKMSGKIQNDIVKFPKQALSFKFIIAAILDQKSDILLCQIISMNLLLHDIEKGKVYLKYSLHANF